MPNRLWRPDPDQPLLQEWFAPLHRFAARVRFDELPFDVRTDEFAFIGRLVRSSRPTLHFYAHGDGEVPGELVVDDEGEPYRQARNRAWLRARSVRAACWAAGLPYVSGSTRHPYPGVMYDGLPPIVPSDTFADGAGVASPGERPTHLRLLVWGDVEE